MGEILLQRAGRIRTLLTAKRGEIILTENDLQYKVFFQTVIPLNQIVNVELVKLGLPQWLYIKIMVSNGKSLYFRIYSTSSPFEINPMLLDISLQDKETNYFYKLLIKQIKKTNPDFKANNNDQSGFLETKIKPTSNYKNESPYEKNLIINDPYKMWCIILAFISIIPFVGILTAASSILLGILSLNLKANFTSIAGIIISALLIIYQIFIIVMLFIF